jgi:malate dehydrogenase (oxaloacetate-decarboxylating)(NADP+)
MITGFERLHDPSLNKGTAFTSDERDRLGLRGLLPARVNSPPEQVRRVLENLRRKESDLERYIFLMGLQDRNERLFFRMLIEHIDEVMPLVYTPTVGQACSEFGHIFRRARGFYITPEDGGQVRAMLDHWPVRDVRVIVVTDGERILGLGDLGANGMGIPIGKLSLYTACAGLDPGWCLPVQIDVGTENRTLLDDPLYLGRLQPRLRGDAYNALLDEFVDAVDDAFPRALIQFEDFQTPNAFALLERYRHRVLCFNDDIQGTGAVVLAGLYAATRISGDAMSDLRILFLGAGSASTGIADLMVEALRAEGHDEAEARSRLWFVDSQGLVVGSRPQLAAHKRRYTVDQTPMGLLEAIESHRPQVLIGATGHGETFTEEVVRKMAGLHERPIIFALSNPTSRAECTAAQAHRWTDGRVVFASGSPFPPLELPDGGHWRPGQGNNAYVFPGVGLGAVGVEATEVTDAMFLAAARALANLVQPEDLASGAVYPPLSSIRDVSLAIGTAVAEVAYEAGLARAPRPASIRDHLARLMYDPRY